MKHYLGTCPLPLPTAPESTTPWALNLPSQQSLGTCLEPLPPRQLLLLLQHGSQPQLDTCPESLPPRPLLLLQTKAPLTAPTSTSKRPACFSVAPVILPSPRPRGLRPHKTAPQRNPFIQSRYDELGADSELQAQRARHARHLRRLHLSTRAKQGR